uniref:Wsv299 n=1 Tax=White spot syndrome virus TaxID=92652 RepID=A0A2U9GD85_WSSV|nr:wsv299 [Shrimp white spot syndrome virus]
MDNLITNDNIILVTFLSGLAVGCSMTIGLALAMNMLVKCIDRTTTCISCSPWEKNKNKKNRNGSNTESSFISHVRFNTPDKDLDISEPMLKSTTYDLANVTPQVTKLVTFSGPTYASPPTPRPVANTPQQQPTSTNKEEESVYMPMSSCSSSFSSDNSLPLPTPPPSPPRSNGGDYVSYVNGRHLKLPSNPPSPIFNIKNEEGEDDNVEEHVYEYVPEVPQQSPSIQKCIQELKEMKHKKNTLTRSSSNNNNNAPRITQVTFKKFPPNNNNMWENHVYGNTSIVSSTPSPTFIPSPKSIIRKLSFKRKQ